MYDSIERDQQKRQAEPHKSGPNCSITRIVLSGKHPTAPPLTTPLARASRAGSSRVGSLSGAPPSDSLAKAFCSPPGPDSVAPAIVPDTMTEQSQAGAPAHQRLRTPLSPIRALPASRAARDSHHARVQP